MIQEKMQQIILNTLADTEHLAAAVASTLAPRDTIALQGDLGTGKTTFARALLAALGWRRDVPSPTYTLIQRYDLPHGSLHHADLYRVQSPDELEEIGLYEAFAEGVCLIEWPERLPRWPMPCLHLHFTLTGTRTVTLTGTGHWQGWQP